MQKAEPDSSQAYVASPNKERPLTNKHQAYNHHLARSSLLYEFEEAAVSDTASQISCSIYTRQFTIGTVPISDETPRSESFVHFIQKSLLSAETHLL